MPSLNELVGFKVRSDLDKQLLVGVTGQELNEVDVQYQDYDPSAEEPRL